MEHLAVKRENPLMDMTVQTVRIGRELREILVTSEMVSQASQIMAWEFLNPSKPNVVKLHGHDSGVGNLRSSSEGRFLAGTCGRSIVIGNLTTDPLRSFEDLKYQFYSFDVSDDIFSFDLRCSPQRSSKGSSASRDISTAILDLVVGCVRGAIFVYHDVMGRLRGAGKSGSSEGTIKPRKLHWHRKTVQSVKWSQDGKLNRTLAACMLTHTR